MYLAFSEMAARSEISPARWRRPFLIWMDGIEAGWAIPLLLIGFVAVWMAFLVIAYLDGDLHPDVLETWTLGRSLEWGYAKHPPLMGWVARAWTSVFPLTNWSFQLLALTNSAIALWAVDLISRRFATRRQENGRAAAADAAADLPVSRPAVQCQHRFCWRPGRSPPIASCARSKAAPVGWAVAAGATAALAMLGKYYSAFLIASFLVARRSVIRSDAPISARWLPGFPRSRDWPRSRRIWFGWRRPVRKPFAYALERPCRQGSCALADRAADVPARAWRSCWCCRRRHGR